MSKTIVIMGSARSEGNTRRVLHFLAQHSQFELVDLNEYEISYFDYQHRNEADDFLPLIERMLDYDRVIFATPVYWYAMSAVMKTFFDRLTDVLKIRREWKPRLAQLKMHSLSCSGHDDLKDYFHLPFKDTATYLNMSYAGHVHTWVDGDLIPAEAKTRLRNLARQLS
ncbi:MAG: NAD(P)H-dependent oxidoreductase [Bacteroidota bacterium]